ncbi:MAG: DEAD/DEAH box helicase [Armatimonadetes bacterium]|nr:DEAD/DEAH box helicase [Armatimonadota bacterium]
MDFGALLDEIRNDSDYAGQIAHVRQTGGLSPRLADLPAGLSAPVAEMLRGLGIERLYSHQAAAVAAALDGENVTTVSGTASGKTLTYLLPIVEAIHRRGTSRALLVYPTKALAQDQLRKLREFGAGRLFTAATYDGDTPSAQRRSIKQQAHVVLTNPDMLHLGILPYHHTWSDFLRNLSYVVLDEVHTYRGVFGAHTANVMRRLRRIAQHYGASPQFLCCSATIGNPRQLAETLTGLPCRLVDDDGAPKGRKWFVFWNPPIIEKLTGRRRSGNLEAADLMARLVRHGIRHLTFTLARSQAELILRYVRDRLQESGQADAVMAYRGGYLPAERREIERRLFSGELLGVTATTALELGVDIGGLDAVLMAGYPGSIASTWQQAGRAGRGQRDALAVLIGLSGPIHQYVVNNPDYLLEGRNEQVVLDPGNPLIRAGHLLCAAYELPLDARDKAFFGDDMEPTLQILADAGYLAHRSKWYWLDPEVYPAAEISIRSASGAAYSIVLSPSGDLLATMDAASAPRMVHPGAIYLHAGQTYRVDDLDVEKRIARVTPADVDYYTTPLTASEVRRLEVQEHSALRSGLRLELADVEVRTQVIGFNRIRQVTEQQLGSENLDLPADTYETVGVWLLPQPEALMGDTDSPLDLAGSLHALEHALIALLPLFVPCDPHDVGGVSSPLHPEVSGPAICIYDGYPGGVGLVRAAYERMVELLQAAANRLATCPCQEGCPGCIQQPSCGSMNRPLSKGGALALASHWLGSGATDATGEVHGG